MLSLVCNTGFLLLAFLSHSAAMQRGLILASTTKTLEKSNLQVPLNSQAEIKRLCIHVEGRELQDRQGEDHILSPAIPSAEHGIHFEDTRSLPLSLHCTHASYTQHHANRLYRATCSALYVSARGHVAPGQTGNKKRSQKSHRPEDRMLVILYKCPYGPPQSVMMTKPD